MQKTRSFILLLLLSALIPSIQVSDIPEKSNDLDVKMLDLIKKYIYHKVSSMLVRLTSLPANFTDSTGHLPWFVNQVIEIGMEYAYDEVHLDLQYILFTPDKPNGFTLQLNQESILKSTFNPSLETKILIHGFPAELTKYSVIFDIKIQLLKIRDYNIIVVNWSNFNKSHYTTVSLNAIFVGFEIAKLIKYLMVFTDISPRTVHLIGHSFGGHSAGFVGKVIPNIGRITGLDVAGPLYDDLPNSLKLTDTDAEFVDAIHTSGSTDFNEGCGSIGPFAHMDFFPNGGRQQPGCSFGDSFLDANKVWRKVKNLYTKAICNHDRALYLFLESIHACRFETIPWRCSKNKDCSHENVTMGFRAKLDTSLPPRSKFYLETKGDFPHCIDSS